MERITFVVPCRNNLQYLIQAVSSIGEHYDCKHDIVILDDASDDGTWDWVTTYALTKDNIITHRNEGPNRVGHTVLYDIGFKLAETPIVSILHSDMIVTPNYVENMLKHLNAWCVTVFLERLVVTNLNGVKNEHFTELPQREAVDVYGLRQYKKARQSCDLRPC